MKKNTIQLIALLTLLSSFLACNDWLDVDSDTNVVQEVLFDDYQGFQTALNGVYMLLGEPQLYTRDLTWGVASVLGNNYNTTTGSPVPKQYKDLFVNDYNTSTSTALIDPIWEKGYNLIANCNNIINQIAGRDTSFFPSGKQERDLILGEMLGVRAMMHFDLVRLFTPAPKADDGKKYIPYMTVYPVQQSEHLTVPELLNHIIRDLEEAKSLLTVNDTEDPVNRDVLSSVSLRFYSRITAVELFFSLRGFRMNYFAATALLARVYQWRDAQGDKQKAYDCAYDMYRFSTERTWFKFTPAGNLQQNNADNIYRKMYDDILFAAYNYNLYDIYDAATTFNEELRLANVSTSDPLYSGDEDDFRYLYLMNGTTNRTSRRWEAPSVSTSDQAINIQGKMAPIIRMSEVYYIMCEYLADTDLTQANVLLNTIRQARGSKNPVDYNTKERFLEALYLEMTREFMTEGQTFFLYKRLNRPIYNGSVPLDMSGRYVLPIPRSENEYINL